MKLPFATDAGMGPGATLGLIVLPADETLENEMRLLLPGSGVALYHSRIEMPPEVTPETLAGMEAALPQAAGMLPEVAFDVIGYGCTSGATVIGPEGVARAINRARPGARVTDPVSATMAACRALGLKRLGFVTPYVESVSAAMRALLEANGFEIAGFGSFEEGDDRVVARIAPESILSAIEAVDAMAACDGVFVSCTNLRVAGIAAEAERRIGKPVISSNLALGWHMRVLAGLTGPAPIASRLFGA
ncbi:Asp/Glu racemase [Defluviimonas sp. D31]|uniref:maleate cis-trans isomerase family protein n=1 Tax=Defluviimonas sp. D31 TaxID=3083253 RepID=UPI00296E7A8E|nr:Asp/Glu racemase [Defluviimonas sp. D31]MDW4550759.1 Asp/Glu racemase [Defluviimonas sp. D31]